MAARDAFNIEQLVKSVEQFINQFGNWKIAIVEKIQKYYNSWKGNFLMSEMTLRMPSNYVELENEEMEYVDGGGFSGYTFKQSWDNLSSIFIAHFGSQAFRLAEGGMTISVAWGYWTTTTVVGSTVATLVGEAAAVVSGPLAIPLGIAAGLGSAALVYWMGTGVRF